MTTDRSGPDSYTKLPGTTGEYAYNVNGTSAANPIVSGVVAPMLQANQNLGYRYVQRLLANCACFINPATISRVTTHSGTWNGGTLFSRDYDLGEVDAYAQG